MFPVCPGIDRGWWGSLWQYAYLEATLKGLHMRLQFELPDSVTSEASKVLREQIFYLDSLVQAVDFDGKSGIVTLSAEPECVESLRASINALADTTAKSFRRVREKVVFQHEGAGEFRDDPLPALLSCKDLRRHAPGIFTFQGDFLYVMNALDRYFRSYALSLGAVEQAYPPTVLAKSMMRNGYLASFPHHALLVAGVGRSSDSVSMFVEACKAVEPIDSDTLAAPAQVLAPTVCYRCFEALGGERLGEKTAIYTGTAHCNRNEGFIEDSLARLQSFTMRELVFIGTASEVERIRYEIIQHAQDCVRSWDLTARLATASDPFFATTDQSKRGYQSLMQLKYEMQFKIPFSDQWISCMSFNNHQRTLVAAYDIVGEGGEDTASGCVGYGLERLAFAICSQYGTDVSRWPEPLADMVAAE